MRRTGAGFYHQIIHCTHGTSAAGRVVLGPFWPVPCFGCWCNWESLAQAGSYMRSWSGPSTVCVEAFCLGQKPAVVPGGWGGSAGSERLGLRDHTAVPGRAGAGSPVHLTQAGTTDGRHRARGLGTGTRTAGATTQRNSDPPFLRRKDIRRRCTTRTGRGIDSLTGTCAG